MDNSIIYKKILLEDGLVKMKNLRDEMESSIASFDLNINYDFEKIQGVSNNYYQFVMEEVNKLNVEIIENTIVSLLDYNKIEYKRIPNNLTGHNFNINNIAKHKKHG